MYAPVTSLLVFVRVVLIDISGSAGIRSLIAPDVGNYTIDRRNGRNKRK